MLREYCVCGWGHNNFGNPLPLCKCLMAHLIWPNDANFFDVFYLLIFYGLSLSRSPRVVHKCLRWLNLLICANHAEHSFKEKMVMRVWAVSASVDECINLSSLALWTYAIWLNMSKYGSGKSVCARCYMCICMIVWPCVFAWLMPILWKPQNHSLCIAHYELGWLCCRYKVFERFEYVWM